MSTTADDRDTTHVLTLEDLGNLTRETGNPAETLMNVVALIASRFQTDVCSAYLLEPDRQILDMLLKAGRGHVRMVTIAPELPGALELIEVLVARGVTVSCGHSDATAEEANAAFDRGARMVTHLFNAMRPFSHRDPGIAGAALARDDVVVGIILDGIHLAPATVAVIWRAAAGRVALITDAVAASSVAGGSYSLGGVALHVQDGAVRAPDGMLAGSLLTMIEAVRNLHTLGVPIENALPAASTVPARALGLADAGRLDVGLPADIVVLDDNLDVERVVVGGETRVVV